MSDIEGRLQNLCRKVFDQDDLVLKRELTAREVKGWDSLSHVQLILGIQKEFKIQIPLVQAGKLKNVGDLIDLVVTKTGTPR